MNPCPYGHASKRGAQNKCLECSRMRGKKRRTDNPEHVRRLDKALYVVNREKRIEDSKQYHARNPKIAMLRNAYRRAQKSGYACTLTLADFEIPQFCPLLGMKLRVSAGGVKPYSPSLDKIRPELGYVPGNIWVISHRANQIKSDATVQELKLLLTNLEKRVHVRQELTIPFTIELPKQGRMPWQTE